MPQQENKFDVKLSFSVEYNLKGEYMLGMKRISGLPCTKMTSGYLMVSRFPNFSSSSLGWVIIWFINGQVVTKIFLTLGLNVLAGGCVELSNLAHLVFLVGYSFAQGMTF
ncbi:hypothetical protein ACJX0J_030882 [Zea mays]